MKIILLLLRKAILLSWRYLLAFLGFFLGFSHAVVAQYGAPENRYSIQGNLVTDECVPLPARLKVTLQQKWTVEDQPYNIGESFTDEKGNFSFSYYDNSFAESFMILVHDEDGEANGSFNDTVFLLPLEDMRFEPEGQGGWSRLYINKTPIVLNVRSNGGSPCDEPIVPEENVIRDSANSGQFADTALVSEYYGFPETVNSSDTAAITKWSVYENMKLMVTAYPNPNSGLLQIKIVINENAAALLRLFDDRYRKLIEQKMMLQPGSNLHVLDILPYAPGVYFLEIQTGNTREIIRIIRLGND